jgi:signal transduction histidine kinase
MQQTSPSTLSVDDLLITSDLAKRLRPRPQDRATVSALQVLAGEISGRPSEALPRLVEMARELCGGGSAGISAYEPLPGGPGIFRWTALSGPAAQFEGETTPRDFSPCGICLDRSEIILMDRPGRYYEWLNLPGLPLTEAILVPLFVNGTEPFGTLWVMSHDEHQFDGDDARILADMASVVGLALSLISGVADREALAGQTRHQTTKMEVLGQLAGGIAHDFSNLLQVLTGQLEILKKRVGDPSLVAMVDRGLGSVLRGEKLIEHLMGFARRRPLKRDVIDLRSTLRDSVDIIARAFPGMSVSSHIADDLWSVLADRSLLEVALLNLAVNSRDAMCGNGGLTISARNVPAEPASSDEDDRVAMTLADDGPGMTPAVLALALEPFFTTKEAGAGTGLGLSMVRDFAEQSGGTVTIESEVGSGTSVTIFLPRAEGLALASVAPTA